MKKMILSALLLISAVIAQAQNATETSEKSLWLTEFSEINANGPFNIVFEQIAETEAPRIVYDTKGSYTSKFRAEVKNSVLSISEKIESKRTTITTVKVYFHTLTKIKIIGAVASFNAPVVATMLDMSIGGGAVMTAAFDIVDLNLEVSGKSGVTLTGLARYLTLTASTSKVDATQLKVMSLYVDASNSAQVMVYATERFDAKTSTGAKITYMGNPAIIRGGASFTGGEITKVD
ncbi:MAG: DUF2807 domain-containing protein [Alistipes sp.]